MKKWAVLLISASLFLSGCSSVNGKSIVLSKTNDFEVEEELDILVENYDKLCPYGDALVVNREEQTFLNNDVGILVDCVNYNKNKNTWETWTLDIVSHTKKHQNYSPMEYRVFTKSGELILEQNSNGLEEKIVG